jgi:hypothetical protein
LVFFVNYLFQKKVGKYQEDIKFGFLCKLFISKKSMFGKYQEDIKFGFLGKLFISNFIIKNE